MDRSSPFEPDLRGGNGTPTEQRLDEIRALEHKLIELKRELIREASSVSKDRTRTDATVFLLLRTADKLAALPVPCVREVLQMTALRPLAKDVPAVRGLVDYHGRMLAVMDLGELMGTGRNSVSLDKVMVICSVFSFEFALMVDEAIDVIATGHGDIQVSDEVLPGALQACGMLHAGGRVAAIIDMWSIPVSVQLGALRDQGHGFEPGAASTSCKPEEGL